MCATVVVLSTPASAAVDTTDLTGSLEPLDLAQALAGPGISVSNVTYSGAEAAAGTFTGGAGIVGPGTGIVLSSGDISEVIGPNDLTNTTTVHGGPGDTDLSALSGGLNTFDASVLEFDFVPSTDQVQFRYVFSSEEYNEFVGGGFNDAFGFFVNGTNCAVVGGSTPVSVDTINLSSNASLYINNDATVGTQLDTEMDGLTVVLTCSASVNAGTTNTMKLAIADAGDAQLDSAVFLERNSLTAVHTLSVTLAGEGSGTVTSDPAGIDCGADCEEGYEAGTPVSLTATPDEGSVFDGWSGDCSGTGSCEVTMTGARNVTATFSPPTPSCGEGEQCDSGTVPPGGTLSTVQGTPGDPTSPGDPFALELRNVSGQNVTGTIVEEACDGTQEGDALCSTPRVAGRAGNFQFTIGGGETSIAASGAGGSPPVTVGALFYDKTVIPKGKVRIFYQKEFGGPVLELRKCNARRRTECFTLEKLKSGDQAVRLPFKDDPRSTRG
jgi:uncharacterized repeat protein (TIGR02543 family)